MKAFFSAHVQRGSTVLASKAATIQRPKGRRAMTSCKQGFCAHKEVLSRLLLPTRWSAQVFTDAAKSYAWLDNSGDYIHRPVVHKKGEFARTDEDGLRVSSNAVEGLFSRAKRHFLWLAHEFPCPGPQASCELLTELQQCQLWVTFTNVESVRWSKWIWRTEASTPAETAKEAFEELVRSGQVPRSKRGGGRFGPRGWGRTCASCPRRCGCSWHTHNVPGAVFCFVHIGPCESSCVFCVCAFAACWLKGYHCVWSNALQWYMCFVQVSSRGLGWALPAWSVQTGAVGELYALPCSTLQCALWGIAVPRAWSQRCLPLPRLWRGAPKQH